MSAQVNEIRVKLKARWYQRPVIDFFRGGGRHAFEVWHRRAGKDRAATFIESEKSIKRVGAYWHCLPEYAQARKAIWDALTKDGERLIDVSFPHAMRKATNNHEMKIEMVNGSIWQLVGSDNINSIVGANPVHVTFSEFALNHPNAREFIRPILAENGGSELIITTPRGYNHAWKLWQRVKNNPAWHTSTVTALESGVLSPEILDEERADMPDELFRQEYLCDWGAANVGAIFGRYMEAAEREGRIAKALEPDPFGQIVLSSDIGYRDKAAWWWWRVMPGGFDLIDYDEASGLDAEEWCDRLERRPLSDGGYHTPPWPSKLFLPHDARAKSFLSRHSAIEIMCRHKRGDGKPVAESIEVNAVRKKSDSINAGRKVLKRCRFDESMTETGIEALRFYHYKYDEEQKVFSPEPEHDWSSHGADAFMEGAAVLHDYVAPPKQPSKASIETPLNRSFSLDQLWETAPNMNTRRV